MTMRTLLTAAAIISSAGFGISGTPTSQPSYNLNSKPVVFMTPAATIQAQLASLDDQDKVLAPEPWANADPADSLYRLAREALSRGDYKRAAEIFHRIPERFPQSAYAGEALYYEAFSLYRSGGDDDLSSARDRLNLLKQK
jgi:outer membrane protein assembly factor BamD (BamD/ComL family)